MTKITQQEKDERGARLAAVFKLKKCFRMEASATGWRLFGPIEREGNSIPCNTIRVTSVTLENKEPATLKAALEAMGYSVRMIGNQVNFSGYSKAGMFAEGSYLAGKLSYQGSLDVAEVKKSYAAEIIQQTYSGFGWDLTKNEDGYDAVKQEAGW